MVCAYIYYAVWSISTRTFAIVSKLKHLEWNLMAKIDIEYYCACTLSSNVLAHFYCLESSTWKERIRSVVVTLIMTEKVIAITAQTSTQSCRKCMEKCVWVAHKCMSGSGNFKIVEKMSILTNVVGNPQPVKLRKTSQ